MLVSMLLLNEAVTRKDNTWPYLTPLKCFWM